MTSSKLLSVATTAIGGRAETDSTAVNDGGSATADAESSGAMALSNASSTAIGAGYIQIGSGLVLCMIQRGQPGAGKKQNHTGYLCSQESD